MLPGLAAIGLNHPHQFPQCERPRMDAHNPS